MKNILRNVVYVSVADIVVKVVSASTTFFVAKLLTPAGYGLWITLILVVSYAPIIALGTIEALLKQYPFYAGKGDFGQARRIESGVLGSILLSSAVLAVGGVVVSILLTGRLSATWVGFARLMLLTASLNLLSCFFYYRFSAHQKFRFVSMIDSGRAVVTFVCLVGLTWLWGLDGTVAGFLVAELSVCVLSGWLCVKQCGRLNVSFALSLIWSLVKVGFPITVIWWVFIIESSADRLISMSILGESATGFYGLGWSLVSLLILLPVALSKVLYPRVSEKMGETSHERDLRSLVVLPTHALGVLIPAAIGLLVFASPVLYRQLLPKYGPGLASAQILLLGSFFVCVVRNGANFLIATNRQHSVLKYVLISLAVNVLGSLALVRSGFGIEGIAFGFSVSACVLATLVWLAVFRHMGAARSVQIRELTGLYMPYLLMLCVLAVCAVCVPGVFADVSPRLGVLGAGSAIIFVSLMYAVPPIRGRSMEVVGLLMANLKVRERR